MLTQEQVEKALPVTLRSAVTQSLVARINNAVSDPEEAQMVRENFLSYSTVLKEGRHKTEDYLSAVMYVSFKLMDMTNQEAYARAFPTRYAALLAKGMTAKDISAYVSAYHKGKLVNKIMEQALVPTWVLNQDLHQKAINHLAHLMLNAYSEKVQSDSANALLTHLAKPKEVGPLININVENASGVDEMRDMLTKMAKQQQELIANGVTAKTIASQNIMDVEAKDVRNS